VLSDPMFGVQRARLAELEGKEPTAIDAWG